jgi:hypothetical protein
MPRRKYIQTQVFDSVFGSREGGPFNANQTWWGRDDTTELYFRDWDHVTKVFTSEHVKTNVGPDGAFFADFETSIVLMAYEKPLSLQTRLQQQNSAKALDEGNATVAMYFISTRDDEREGEQLEKVLSPALISALEECAQDEVWGVIANIGIISTKFDLNAYFGGGNMPQYALVYKIFLKNNESVPVFRKAQAAFVKSEAEKFDVHKSFVVFSKEALIMDTAKDIRVSTGSINSS